MAAPSQDSLTSSPDLLGEPGAARASSPAKSVKRGMSTTPKRQIARPVGPYQLHDFYLQTPTGPVSHQMSPSRSTAQAENVISPWRIRVRVEAEREEENTVTKAKRGRKPSVSPTKQFGRTITTTVPLKESDDTPAPQKRGRGRPRKTSSPVKNPVKRPGTPKPGRGRKRVVEEEDGDFSETSKGGNTPKVKRPRRTPAKRAESQPDKEAATPAVKARRREELQDSGRSSLIETRPSGGNDFDVAEDDAVSRQGNEEDGNNGSTTPTEPEEFENIPSNSSPKARKPLIPMKVQRGQVKASVNKPSDPIEAYSDAEGSEFDSIAEGEDFSVVSLSTLPSAQQHLNSRGLSASQGSVLPNSVDLQHRASHSLDTLKPQQLNSQGTAWPHPSISRRPQEAESEMPTRNTSILTSDNSSLLQLNTKRRTPSQLFSSPALPPLKSAQVARSSDPESQVKGRGTSIKRPLYPKLSSHGAYDQSPEPTETDPVKTRQTSTGQSHDDLFKGFGVKTRRELRAGLRLGVELAKRQHQKDDDVQNAQESDGDIFQALALSDHVRSECREDSGQASQPVISEVAYPELRPRKQLPTPETSQDERAEKKVKGSEARNSSTTSSMRERLEVIRQVDKAAPSEVVVINARDSSSGSTNEHEGENEVGLDDQFPQDDMMDIWQTEARSTSNSHNVSQIAVNSTISSSAQIPRSSHQDIRTQLVENKADFFPTNQQIDLSGNRMGEAMRYATPSPRKEQEIPDPAYTGLTNFSTEMQSREVELPHQVPHLEHSVVSVARKRSSSLETQEQPVRSRKRQPKAKPKRQLWKKRPLHPSTRSQPALHPATQGLTTQAQDQKPTPLTTTAPPQQIRPQEQQALQPEDFSFRTAWQEAVFFYPLLQSATSAFTSLTSSNPSSKVLLPATFQTPPTPPNKPTSLLTTHLPFNEAHYARLRTIYMKAQRHPLLYRLPESSPCRDLLGLEVESMGWRRKLEEWELGAVDDFLRILKVEGVRDQRVELGLEENGAVCEEIGVEEVVKRVFSLWVGQVQRGEVDLRDGVAGCWDKRFVGRRGEVLRRQRAWKESRVLK